LIYEEPLAAYMSSRFPGQVDVLVVGGGPAGLASAIAARRHDLSVLVADGAVPPIDKACGEGLMPDGVDALRWLGVMIPDSQAQAFRGIRFINGRQKTEALFPRGTAYGIRRTALHRILLEHAASMGVFLAWKAPVSELCAEGAIIGGELVRARWVVGADGGNSRVRRWARLDAHERNRTRMAARCHYRVRPWTELVEVHWSECGQAYVTPVGAEEVCVALIYNHDRVRFDDALGEFAELSARLEGAERTSDERGAITANRKLRRVYRGNVALVGDASGAVDAITGEGLCLAFRQAALLGECLASGTLERYQAEHSKLIRRPALMARLLLVMGRHSRLRERTMQMFEATPRSFAAMLSMHIGEASARDYVASGISLGWRLLTA
jgi:menaquinone-9 beta-reductase